MHNVLQHLKLRLQVLNVIINGLSKKRRDEKLVSSLMSDGKKKIVNSKLKIR